MSLQKAPQSTSALELYLHPLVIINISDHYTREKMNGKSNPRVIGALYGQQSGRKVAIKTCFELKYSVEDGKIILDQEYADRKKQLYAQVFPEHEILGWYSTGENFTNDDFDIHKQVMFFNESPFYLVCDVIPKQKQKDLPVYLFEVGSTYVDKQQVLNWLRLDYNIETEESERITVDTVNNLDQSQGSNTSTLVPHFSSLTSAVTMLQDRVAILIKYLEEVQKGNIPKDHEMIRKISSLCNRLPAVDSPKFRKDYTNELNEVLLITYMSTITKGTNVLSELIEKYNVAFERRGQRKSMF